MSSYPLTVRRCRHIKVNGTQCGSPALRDEAYCYYHLQTHQQNMHIDMNLQERGTITLPILEDANSIQVGLAEVMRLLVSNQIDHRTAALLLHALRTASVNIKRTSFEPPPTLVVIDRESVERRPIGATAWSIMEGCEYDDSDEYFNPSRKDNENVPPQKFDGDASFDSMLTHLIARATLPTHHRNGRRGAV